MWGYGAYGASYRTHSVRAGPNDTLRLGTAFNQDQFSG